MQFEFAKKMSRPSKNDGGITLRSITGDTERCTMVIMASDYSDIKASVVNYRMLTSSSLVASARGKSLEITAQAGSTDAIAVIFSFAKSLRFNTQDAEDVMEFYPRAVTEPVKSVNIALTPETLSLVVCADIDADQDPNTIYGSLDAVCTEYGVGIVKEHTDEL